MTPRLSPEISRFRCSVYRIFSEWFFRAPSKDLLRFFTDPEWMESACSLLGPEIQSLGQDLAREFDSDQLATEFAALFIVPGPQQTFPFESNYREGGRVYGERRPGRMLGYSTAEVQREYLEWGVTGDLDTEELPDHAGVELRFMSLLVEAEYLSWERYDDACARMILQTEAEFLNHHILQWMPQWIECVKKRARLAFYKSAATVLGNFLRAEKTTLDQVLDTSHAPSL